MQKKTFALLGIILILCFLAVPSRAGDLLPEGLVIEDTYRRGLGQPVGRFLRVQGDVVIIHKGEPIGYLAHKGLPVYKMDTLISLEQSRSIVEMNDRSRLSMTARTRITVNRSQYNKTSREKSSFFSMVLGKARFWVTKMAMPRRSEFQVKTVTAVVGVRGSDFVVEASLESTEVTTLADTELEVISTAIPEEPVILTNFQQTTVDIDTPPSDVIDISSDVAAELMNELPVETGEDPLPDEVLESLEGKKAETSSGDTPEWLVDDGELIEPEAIGDDLAGWTPDLELEDWLQKPVEDFNDIRDDISEELKAESVAGELPDYPGLPE